MTFSLKTTPQHFFTSTERVTFQFYTHILNLLQTNLGDTSWQNKRGMIFSWTCYSWCRWDIRSTTQCRNTHFPIIICSKDYQKTKMQWRCRQTIAKHRTICIFSQEIVFQFSNKDVKKIVCVTCLQIFMYIFTQLGHEVFSSQPGFIVSGNFLVLTMKC